MLRPLASGVLSLVLVTCAMSGTLKAEQPPIRWHKDLNVAQSIAKALKRPLLVVVTTKACVACTQLKRTTFQDQQVVSEVRRSFVPAIADAARYPELMKSLRVASYPTTVIITPERRVTDIIIGYIPPEQMQQRLRMATRVHVGQRTDSQVQ